MGSISFPSREKRMGEKPALERLDDFDPYKDYLKRSAVIDEFYKEIENSMIKSVLLEPKEDVMALLMTFVEWLEKRKE